MSRSGRPPSPGGEATASGALGEAQRWGSEPRARGNRAPICGLAGRARLNSGRGFGLAGALLRFLLCSSHVWVEAGLGSAAAVCLCY